MSYFTESPTLHDLFVGIAVRRLLAKIEGGILLFADGGVPFFDCLRPSCPSLLGYRPDAIVCAGSILYIIETKSAKDVYNSHSGQQFLVARELAGLLARLRFYLFIYDDRAEAIGPSGTISSTCFDGVEIEYANVSGENNEAAISARLTA